MVDQSGSAEFVTGRGAQPRLWRWFLPVALALAVFVPTSVGANDGAPPEGVTVLGTFDGWTAFSGRYGYIYGKAGEPYVAFGGDDINAVCFELPPTQLALTKQQADGTWTTKIPLGGSEQTVYVYENNTGGGVFDYLDATCPAIAEGAPAPAPFAVGPVVLRAKSWDVAEAGYWDFVSIGQPAGRYWNTIGGDAFTADGQRYRVWAIADYELPAEGPPTFFQERLVVRQATG